MPSYHHYHDMVLWEHGVCFIAPYLSKINLRRPLLCENHCKGTTNCVAFTYTKNSVCTLLKSTKNMKKVRHEKCISGKVEELTSGIRSIYIIKYLKHRLNS